MSKNPLIGLESFGQSIWLDFLRRNALENGDIKKLIDEDGVSGMTSNPAIFEKAIAGSNDYDASITALARDGKSIEQIYEALTVEDIQHAADLFRPTFDRTDGADGFVSLEVSPRLAHDTAGSVAEARHLWAKVNRPNVMIKIPGTREGIPAIQQLIGEGININVTLLFGLPRYQEVVEAYIAGLETLAASGKPLNRIASVASFFLSRIDALIDPMIEKLRLAGGSVADVVASMHGEVAISSARVAYQIYQEAFGSERFKQLAAQGAHTQRLLWASTSTKNPDYSDVKYVEALIGSNTIDTVPMETLAQYRDHGQPAARLEDSIQEAYRILDALKDADLDIDALTQHLEDDGVKKFNQAFDQLMSALQEKRDAAVQKSATP